MSKFKVGDYVRGIDQERYNVTNSDMTKGEITAVYTNGFQVVILDHKDKSCIGQEHIVEDEYFELIDKFTFQEVIARMQPGEVYECTRGDARLLKIHCEKGWMGLEGRPTLSGSFGINSKDTFKLVESKKQYIIYEVDHSEGGKRYSFSSEQDLCLGNFVVCDTHGRCYGRVVSFDTKELTEAEYKEYKKCWRA